jgi:hypothetical protein
MERMEWMERLNYVGNGEKGGIDALRQRLVDVSSNPPLK